MNARKQDDSAIIGGFINYDLLIYFCFVILLGSIFLGIGRTHRFFMSLGVAVILLSPVIVFVITAVEGRFHYRRREKLRTPESKPDTERKNIAATQPNDLEGQ